MQKKLEYNEGNFIIGYCESHDIVNFKNKEILKPVTIEFITDQINDEKNCILFANSLKGDLVNEAEKLFIKNSSFYQYLEISFNSFRVDQIRPNSIYGKNPREIVCSMDIEWKLKE